MPVAVDLIKVNDPPPPFPSSAPFLALTFNLGTRTIAPYFYNADGTPDVVRTAVILGSTPALDFVFMFWCKRTAGQAHILVRVSRASSSTTMIAYNIATDTWSTEIAGAPPAFPELLTVHDVATETGDAFWYHYGRTLTGNNAILRRLSMDLVGTDLVVGSTPLGANPIQLVQVDANTLGYYGSTDGSSCEIDIDGTVRPVNSLGYWMATALPGFRRTFPSSHFLGETIAYRDRLPYEITAPSPNISQVARFSGWSPLAVPAVETTVALNDNKNAIGIFPFTETASPPSRSLDWIDALPKTAPHASLVEIRPTDYVSPGSPGTLAALPDACFPLSAAP